MKKIILSLVVLASSIFALQAQNNMVIHQGNGSTLSLPLQSIDSVRFNLVPPPAMKRIFQNNGNILSLSVADIDSITYTIPNRSTLPTLTTQAVTVLSSSSAFGGGNISADGGSAVTQRGVCWNISPNPTLANNFTVDGTSLGSYGSTMQPLSPSTTYYVRAYATNANGTSYGNEVSFVTAPASNNGSLPTISTNQVVYMDSLSAYCGGDITADGGLAVTARGVCWAIGTTPTINHNRTLDGSGAGSFNSRLANLLPSTSYFVRAYATNDAGTSYGVTYSFTTVGFATVLTDSVFDITAFSAQALGTIVSNGGASVSQRGFCWSNSPNPTINDSNIEEGIAKISTLNAVLASFGAQPSSEGVDGELIYISGTNPGCGQILVDLAGKIALIERGGCTFIDKVINAQNAGAKGVIVFQNSDEDPFSMGGTNSSINIPSVMISRENGLALVNMLNNQSILANIKQTSASVSRLIGANQFVSQITNLLPDTLYYLRSFAQNNVGVSYGNQIVFRTQSGIPVVVTDSVRFVGATFAGIAGTVLTSSGAEITDIGVCWSKEPNPTYQRWEGNWSSVNPEQNKVGSFSVGASGLQEDTFYYFRTYVSTAIMRTYGNQVVIKTMDGIPVVVTDSVWNIDVNKVKASGKVISDGGAMSSIPPPPGRGFCWSLTPSPTINDNYINCLPNTPSWQFCPSGLGVYTYDITDLLPDTIYYLRSFAGNHNPPIVAYGDEISFRTLKVNISLNTDSVFGILPTSVQVRGNVLTSNIPVLSKGFCLSTSPNPTINDSISINGQGLGSYNHNFTNLLRDQTYYVRSYASYINGTIYGNEYTFKTPSG